MSSGKIRRIDFYPDEYVSGVGARLTAVEQGVYWMVCSLVYSRGGPIDEDVKWLSRLFADTHSRTVRAALDRLMSMGKIVRLEGEKHPQMTVKRCSEELEKALKRTSEAAEHGRKGGRPPNKNKDLAKPDGFSGEKLTTNQQPPTSTVSNETDVRPKPARSRVSYTPEFESAWKAYPTDPLMSKQDAYRAWQKLDLADRELVARSIPAFKRYCAANPDYRPVHMVRYITQRRFEGMAATNGAAKASSGPDEAELARRHDLYSRRGIWDDAWGEPPPKRSTGDGE